MTKHRYIYEILKILTLLAVCSVLLVACVKSELIDQPNVGVIGKPVKVSLSFSISSLTTPPVATASDEAVTTKLMTERGLDNKFKVKLETSSVEDSRTIGLESRAREAAPLYNLWVLQFGVDKKLARASKMSNTPEPVKELITIDADLVIGINQSIYLVCLGYQYGDVDLSSIKDIAELENYQLESVRYVNGVLENVIQQDKDIPYLGFLKGVDVILLESDGRGYVKDNSNSGFVGRIPMRAMVSKVTFNFSYDVTDLTPSIMSLNNVPTTFSINPPDDYKPNNFVSLPAINLDGVSFVAGKRYEISWYVAPNRQGEVSTIIKQEERYFYFLSGVATGTAPSDGTYINIWASDISVAARYALYYIFVGTNTTTDFNINPQTHYILRSDINTAPSENDNRVIFSTLEQKIDFNVTKYISGSLKAPRTGPRYNLDASAGRRPIEITALRGSVTVDIVDSETGTNPVPVDDSWMQLSASSNYTDAINRKNRGDKDALTTSLKIKTDIPGLIKLYLYNDEYMNYTTAEPSGFGLRELYIRFTFSSLTQPDEVFIYMLRQHCALYIGQLGGNQDAFTGVYSHGLVMSNKFSVCSEDYLSYHIPTSGTPAIDIRVLKVGIYPDVRSYWQGISEFELDDRENGKISTMLYAENRSVYQTMDRLSIALATTTIQAPRRSRGKLDLYQYQGKYNSAEGFAARWCYDKNRDKNGDGEINYLPNDPINNEMVWYLPSVNQLRSFGLNYYGTTYVSVVRNIIFHHLLASTFHSNITPYWIRPYNPTSLVTDAYEVRCVRDVELPVNISYGKDLIFTAPKVEIVDGYAVINASGLVAGASAYKTAGDKYINSDGRNVRHVEQQYNVSSIGAVTSARFRVAPHNIDSLGVKTTDNGLKAQMNWSHASGYNQATNKLVLTIPVSPANTGCAMYTGVSSDPSLGKWRLPTANEMILIDMMEQRLIATSAVTNYTPLSFYSARAGAVNGQTNYWTATEVYSATVSQNGYDRALVYKEDYQRDINGLVIRNNRFASSMLKSSFLNCYVRCVQDIP